MLNTAPKDIRVETQISTPIAKIYYGEKEGTALATLLERQKIKVLSFPSEAVSLEKSEGANYLFFFAQGELSGDKKNEFKSLLETAARHQTKVVLILKNVAPSSQQDLERTILDSGWPVTVVEIRGVLNESRGDFAEGMGKVARFAFSSRRGERVVILGDNAEPPVLETKKENPPPPETQQTALQELVVKNEPGTLMVRKDKHPSFLKKFFLGAVIVLLLLFVPIILMGYFTYAGISDLKEVRAELSRGNSQKAGELAAQAKANLGVTKELIDYLVPISSFVGLEKQTSQYYALVEALESAAETLIRLSVIEPQLRKLPKLVLGEEEGDLEEVVKKIQIELEPIDRSLALIYGQFEALDKTQFTRLMSMVGQSRKMSDQISEIPQYRRLIAQSQSLLRIFPDLVASRGKKSYLLVFQNSAELRPTGGFIGSYAIVRFDQGKLQDYKINDIYTADGQLKGKIEPPDEILHFLGQPNWYMRDANFAADFPLTARRLIWFLEKETNQNVDGVIALNLGTIHKILQATGPLEIPDFKETVNSENFFEKAEYAAEINFFPGSTQKRDFLGAVGQAILDRITRDQNIDWLTLMSKMSDALEEKDMLFYVNSAASQTVLDEEGWSGSIRRDNCRFEENKCLVVIESNFGANKSNHFLQREIDVEAIIDKGGYVTNTVKITYNNKSPSSAWPGGKYKNYLRILVPNGSKFLSFGLGDARKASLSSVLTAAVLSKLRQDQFLVFETNEGAVLSDSATPSAYRSFGALIEVPVKSKKTVTFSYAEPVPLDFRLKELTHSFTFLKQPGAERTKLRYLVGYPSFLAVERSVSGQNEKGTGSTAQLEFSETSFNRDATFEMKFKKK